ncbi:MAG: glycosyltransferase [Geminicoccaceae bacterium]|nr:glycosyltransferase [Geminicoccaceae bacterium]
MADRVGSHRPLGELLVAGRLLEPIAVEEAARLARRWRVPLGEVLVARRLLKPLDLYRTLARQLGLPFLDLRRFPPEPDLLDPAELDWYVAHRAVPWRRVDGRIVWATTEPQALRTALARRWPDRRAVVAVTSKFDLLWALEGAFASELGRRALEDLAAHDPACSARNVITPPQLLAGWLIASLFLVGLAVDPLAGFVFSNGLLLALFLASVLFKVVLATAGAVLPGIDTVVSEEEIASLREEDLPTYTVLVPMYREPEVLPILAAALRRLDYPLAKLDVKLVLEADDETTIAAAKALDLEGIFEIVVVPPSEPRTKPKACNYALQLATGEYLVIYDAEDKPEPDQLKKAVAAFRKADPRTACLQARLNFYNADENWLTRMFTLDYSLWFDLMLPALDRFRMPIPLGGTSNHFRTAVLRELHAWDPFNVTEDADLGIRLAKKGYRVGVIDSTTFEEANCAVGNWIRQRSRWLKGYMQTWLVHMRDPVALLRAVGPRGFLAFQLFVGGTVAAALINPLLWATFLAWLALRSTIFAELFPGWLLYPSGLALILGNTALVYLAAIGPLKRSRYGLVAWALSVPVYWALMSIAGWKALAQLVRRPFYWEKTRHGISVQTAAELAAAHVGASR